MLLQDPSLLLSKAIVIGEQVVAQDGSTFEVLDPATSNPVATVPDLNADACTVAVNGAITVAPQLRRLTGQQRGHVLRQWHRLLLAARDDLANIITMENGKPKAEALSEVDYAAGFVDWFAGAAPRIEGNVLSPGNSTHRVVTIKQPLGVAGIITPWNFPAAMVARKVAAALAAGCPCVVKPAAETPLTALALAELALRAGLPAGALSIITTLQHTAAIGRVLTQHPGIRKFSFTGSTAVGKLLAAQCASTVKRVSLELGGNAPFIVFEDADLAAAVDGLLACKFRLSGQTCVCANRAFVQAGIYDRFASAVVAKVNSLHVGAGSEPTSTLGPLISPKAVDKVQRHIADALDRGATLLTGGNPEPAKGEAFFQPTVLSNVSPDALCGQEETFGPLLPLIKFETEAEVVKLANATEVGLAGYFFTENASRAWRVAEELEVGMVGVNTGAISDPTSPFGGVKESGLGREGSSYGIEEFLEVKTITTKVASL